MCTALARPPEVWKVIESHPCYLVSTWGRVWSQKHRDLLRPHDRGNGYEAVWLLKNGQAKQRYVHELVCGTFHGPRPEGKIVDHRNDLRRDNQALNLGWVTYAENARRMVQAGRAPGAKLTPSHVRWLRTRAGDIDPAAVARRWDVPRRTIRRILDEETWVGV